MSTKGVRVNVLECAFPSVLEYVVVKLEPSYFLNASNRKIRSKP